MNTSLDRLRYIHKSDPLEHKLTFNELQARPVGFQTAIPMDTTLEKMNSLEFKSMEGAMFEAANMASGRIRAEKQTEVMVDQAGNFEVQGVKLKGKLTAGENLADLGGLKLGESMRAAERDCTQ